MAEDRQVVIIGSGPAGISTGLSLRKLAPGLAENLLILEKARHPREKLCGGGVTSLAEQILQDLGIQSTPPGFAIHRVQFWLGSRPLIFERENLMRIVRRAEFDFSLVQAARHAGIEILEGQTIKRLQQVEDGIQIETATRTYRTRVLVGADGARSFVRRKLMPRQQSRISRLMEVLAPVTLKATEFAQHQAVFDFRQIEQHLQGYVWQFPTFIGAQPFLNVGIFDSRIHAGPRADLNALLTEKLAQLKLERCHIPVQGHPERWFLPKAAYARPHVLLVGDAAGIEPWLGEGISIALSYGPVAAAEIAAAFECNDWSFSQYTRRIANDKLGKLLNRNRRIARFFYARPSRPVLSAFGRTLEMYFKWV